MHLQTWEVQNVLMLMLKLLESDVVICYKQRAKANVISHMELIGNVEGKNVVLVDDMVDTAGTLTKAADLND